MARTITKGETLTLIASADAGASVRFVFAGPAQHAFDAAEDSGGFSVSIETDNWPLGLYAYQAISTAGGKKSVIGRGQIEISESLSDIAPGTDMRTTAQQAVDNITAMLSGKATLGARRYKINNRELERYSVAELMKLLTYWKTVAAKEARKAAGLSTLGPRIEFRI